MLLGSLYIFVSLYISRSPFFFKTCIDIKIFCTAKKSCIFFLDNNSICLNSSLLLFELQK